MRCQLGLRHYALVCLQIATALASSAHSNFSTKLLSSSFTPPSTFENTNLVRNINLERSYPREITNIVIKNVAKESQSEYFFQFPTHYLDRISGLEVSNKKTDKTYSIELAQFEIPSPTSYYIIKLSEPLEPADSITITISYALLSATEPLPAVIEQTDSQTIVYAFSAFSTSAYSTSKQKTKLKLPSAKVAEFTKLEKKNADGASDPVHLGSSLTYGPYDNIAAGSELPVFVRYDYTKPILKATRFERDIEVSHWGGNLAFEERYWLTNRAAKLKKQFSRVQWQMAQYSNPPTTAARELHLTLQGDISEPYYIDDIGNVSTSRFRPGRRESSLELKPRYPIFGGWNYSFKIGWNSNLKSFLRKSKGESYVLKVPFLEGPRTDYGMEYSSIQVRVILPEGATNVQYQTSLSRVDGYVSVHKSFMDTVGRPTIVLTSTNAIEEWRGSSLIVTYDYAWIVILRKPLTVAASVFSVFFATWVVGNLDFRIGKTKVT